MHWATLRRHSSLLRAVTSASSQVSPILKSLLTVLLLLVRGRPGPLLNPGTSQCSACWGMRCWSMRITCPSQHSLLSLSTSSMQCCPVSGSDLFVCYAIFTGDAQDTPLPSMNFKLHGRNSWHWWINMASVENRGSCEFCDFIPMRDKVYTRWPQKTSWLNKYPVLRCSVTEQRYHPLH